MGLGDGSSSASLVNFFLQHHERILKYYKRLPLYLPDIPVELQTGVDGVEAVDEPVPAAHVVCRYLDMMP